MTGGDPRALMMKEVGHLGLTHLRSGSDHSPHAQGAQPGDPDGRRLARPVSVAFGELCEGVPSLRASSGSTKPVGLDGRRLFNGPLIELCDRRAVDEGFMRTGASAIGLPGCRHARTVLKSRDDASHAGEAGKMDQELKQLLMAAAERKRGQRRLTALANSTRIQLGFQANATAMPDSGR